MISFRCILLASSAFVVVGGWAQTAPAPNSTPAVAPTTAAESMDKMDTRRPLPLLPMMANHQKQNMRDHLLAVQEIVAALATDDFSPVSLRFGTAYGASPRLRLDIVLNNLVGWALTTGAVRLQSDGTAWRPLIHVEDMAAAAVAALGAPRDLIHGEAFNVGANDANYVVRELATIVADVLGDVV